MVCASNGCGPDYLVVAAPLCRGVSLGCWDTATERRDDNNRRILILKRYYLDLRGALVIKLSAVNTVVSINRFSPSLRCNLDAMALSMKLAGSYARL
jgi:hypothetical protein